jgi:hypothetical protein
MVPFPIVSKVPTAVFTEFVRTDLLFLIELVIQLSCHIEVLANLPGTLGFTNVFHSPALGADDFIYADKASENDLKTCATLRVLAVEGVRDLIKIIGHSAPPVAAKISPA